MSAEAKWTMAVLKDGFHDLALENRKTWMILKDGVVVGKIKWFRGSAYRGYGAAWEGTLFNAQYGMDVKVKCTVKENLLSWFKTGEMTGKGWL